MSQKPEVSWKNKEYTLTQDDLEFLGYQCVAVCAHVVMEAAQRNEPFPAQSVRKIVNRHLKYWYL